MPAYQQTKNTQGAEGHQGIRGSDSKNKHLRPTPLIECGTPQLPASSGGGEQRPPDVSPALQLYCVSHNQRSTPAGPQREKVAKDKNQAAFLLKSL